MYKHCPPGLEVMGWDKLEPTATAYTEKKYYCPLKDFAATITGASKAATDTRCKQSCAWWNAAKGRCGMIK